MLTNPNQRTVIVIGAGPAGIYAAKTLADNEVKVVLLNRDIKPGGLAEYGIFFDKYKMKSGLRKQFHKILQNPNITYMGNVTIGENGAISLPELRSLGADAIIVAVGAQGTKWLGTPGEQFQGVYHAKDLVYHYNQLPPFAENSYPMGNRVAIVGAGNVMMDIANYCIRHLKVDEVIAIVRRDVSAVKFDCREMSTLFANLDQQAFNQEVERTRAMVEGCGVDVDAAKSFVYSAEKRAKASVSSTIFRFEFLSTVKSICSNDGNKVTHLEVEDNILTTAANGRTRPKGSGKTRRLDVDSIVYAIGDTVDLQLGLPTDKWGEFPKSANPKFKINDISYEALHPDADQSLDGIFLTGWAREASSGLVGEARKDGVNCATAVLQFIKTQPSRSKHSHIVSHLKSLNNEIVFKEDIERLTNIETERAEADGEPEFKFTSNSEMLMQLRS